MTKRLAYSLLLILNVLVVYSNHFRNDFQFDDINAIPNNPAIRQPATIVRAFVDANLFSSAPQQRTYRPVTTASLALDYWLGGDSNVFFFHLSTFLWFSVLLVLMFLLFERLMNQADPHPSNFWTALAAAAAFGVHPASAETINYIVQRADLYNALGCVASLWLFIRYPGQRRFGWYLLPAALAMLAKPPALIFPLLLFAYLILFEEFEETEPAATSRWKAALGATLPALALSVTMALLLKGMQPQTWGAGVVSPGPYRLTQPFVALHYFGSFFLPTQLNVDPGWHPLSPSSLQAVAGYLFVAILFGVAVACCRTRIGKPVAFGIFWFLATLLPTSLMPLSDVTNDHRMFFSFVGLTTAVFWSLRMALFRRTARLTRNRAWITGAVAALTVVLIAAGVATRARNRVWLTRESLWHDSVAKNPRNPRALINYGSVAYDLGDYDTALVYWERALKIDPDFSLSQVNLARVAMKLHRSDLAEAAFRRIVTLYPSNPAGYCAYADWLASVGRFDDAIPLLNRARQLNPNSEDLKRHRINLITSRDAADRISLFRALDADHDDRLSAGEMVAAPAALLALDQDGDGKLTAEECGANGDSQLPRAAVEEAHRQFMRSNPLLWALDANHDGELSAAEIRNAEAALEQLDRDRSGMLEAPEVIPAEVRATILRLLNRLDRNHNGQIEADEFAAEPLRSLLTASDIDGDGVVTLEELTNEILHRADQKKDGMITPEGVNAVIPGDSAASPLPANRRQDAAP